VWRRYVRKKPINWKKIRNEDVEDENKD